MRNDVTPLEIIQKYYLQRDLAAREWREKGGKVVGYFCNNVPEEIILAAGFFPLRISQKPYINAKKPDKVDEYGISRLHEDMRSFLSLILNGEYDFLDYLVISNTRVSITSLFGTLSRLKESDPALKIPTLYFFDNLTNSFYTSQIYDRDTVFEFKNKLEEWAGKEISNESLSQAAAVVNENRVLLKKMAALRTANPARISGVEALQLIGSSMFMLKEEHNQLLKEFLKGADQFTARKGLSLFFAGSPLDNPQLYEIIESCNATVVAEDNCWGNRSSDVPVDTSISDPLEAIVARYNHRSPCPWNHPLIRRVEYCINAAVEAKVQGAIFYSKRDDVQAWDIPDEIKGLEDKGIPSLYFKKQPNQISDPEKLKTSIREFSESILTKSQ